MELEINYKGEDLYIIGKYHEGEDSTWDYPGSPPEFEILSVSGNEDEIDLTELEAYILEELEF